MNGVAIFAGTYGVFLSVSGPAVAVFYNGGNALNVQKTMMKRGKYFGKIAYTGF
jgi:hypothetical protein